MAIACLRLFTFLPLLPLRRLPFFRLCMARFTDLRAPFPYLAIVPPVENCVQTPATAFFLVLGLFLRFLAGLAFPDESLPLSAGPSVLTDDPPFFGPTKVTATAPTTKARTAKAILRCNNMTNSFGNRVTLCGTSQSSMPAGSRQSMAPPRARTSPGQQLLLPLPNLSFQLFPIEVAFFRLGKNFALFFPDVMLN